MKIIKTQKVCITTTPNELRKIADEMEKKWAEVNLGDYLATHYFYSEDCNVEIQFVIDQTKIK